MARTNLSVLPDVSGCLRDAMDTMFSNGNYEKINNKNLASDENDVIIDVVNVDDESLINKRKLANAAMTDHEQQNGNGNGNDSAKRLCKMTDY